MTEEAPKQEKMPKAEYMRLAEELSQRPEGFPFPGISPDAYKAIKEGEQEDPGYATPIDVLIERFREHGMKVVLGKNPQSGNVFIVPSDSIDIEQDSIFPRHLEIDEHMDSELKRLVIANKK